MLLDEEERKLLWKKEKEKFKRKNIDFVESTKPDQKRLYYTSTFTIAYNTVKVGKSFAEGHFLMDYLRDIFQIYFVEEEKIVRIQYMEERSMSQKFITSRVEAISVYLNGNLKEKKKKRILLFNSFG